ncbi:MAG: outer membrane protein assembly factor BamA [Gammaproteobacteria bacterium]|nr:outer membrane protein assembly factor BamA [Gammaproteobacteria bacterium]
MSDIRIEGLERIADGTLLNYLPVHIGDSFDVEQTGYAIQELYKTGFFKDVKLARDDNVLVVQVVERPAIAEVKFDGNNDIDDEQLEEILKDIGIVKGRVFNPSALDKIEQGLKQQAYFSQGKYGVRIDTKVTELERNRVKIEIDISEGVIARIKQINIAGNKVYDDDRLLSELQLGVPGFWEWFSSEDEYAKPKLSADLEAINSYYQDRGYVRFKIDSTQVSITPDKKDIYININVTEGDVYKINEINLAGELIVEEEKIRALMLVKSNELFSRRKMVEGQDLITKLLGNEGYAFAKVRVLPEIDDETKSVNLTYSIHPGKKVYVRRISFDGNYKTHDEVLRREMRLMEGAELSNSKLERSKVRLQRLAYVEEVEVDKLPVPGTDDLVDIKITIKERLSGSFNIGAGFSQNQGFVFNLGLEMDNLMGTGQKLSLNFNNDSANKIYSLAFTDPYYTVDGISRTFNFSYRERDTEEEDIVNYLENTYGASVTYGIPLTEYDSIRLGVGFEHTDIIRGTDTVTEEVEDFLAAYGEGEVDVNGDFLEAAIDAFTLVASYSHDTRNRTVFANQGSSQTVVLDLTTPGSDLQYYKVNYRTKFYFPLTTNYTLLLRTDLAYGDGYKDTETFPFYERFFAGGLRTVRGFESNSLGPVSQATGDPVGGDIRTVAGAEVIFPVPFLEQSPRSVRFSAFYDIGNVFLKDDYPGLPGLPNRGGFDKDELRSSIGVSFVWLAPIGPLRFSWARPVENKDGDQSEHFQFSIGSFF